ncbi:MAG TPA: alpha/beta hydrolase [Alteraurantiacibacter sp.]
MIDTRHLVDREILPMLDMPDVVLTPETLAEVRANPLFTGDDLPPAPFPITEARAPVEGGPDARLVVIDPPSDKRGRGAILHIHGGGMVVGTADNAGKTKWDLAEDHDCVIVSVDYRLCPENPFPAPQEDCYAGLVWLAEHADELNVDPDRIVCMGESAGGCLAASLAQMTRDRGGPRLAGQVLIYPMLDWRTGGPDDLWANRHTGEFIWTREKNRFGWEALRGDYSPTDHRKGWFSPTLADDLAGLAPAYIATGALDLFLDEDLDYARRLIDAGVHTELHVYPGAIHAFELVPETRLQAQAEMDLHRGLRLLMG